MTLASATAARSTKKVPKPAVHEKDTAKAEILMSNNDAEKMTLSRSTPGSTSLNRLKSKVDLLTGADDRTDPLNGTDGIASVGHLKDPIDPEIVIGTEGLAKVDFAGTDVTMADILTAADVGNDDSGKKFAQDTDDSWPGNRPQGVPATGQPSDNLDALKVSDGTDNPAKELAQDTDNNFAENLDALKVSEVDNPAKEHSKDTDNVVADNLNSVDLDGDPEELNFTDGSKGHLFVFSEVSPLRPAGGAEEEIKADLIAAHIARKAERAKVRAERARRAESEAVDGGHELQVDIGHAERKRQRAIVRAERRHDNFMAIANEETSAIGLGMWFRYEPRRDYQKTWVNTKHQLIARTKKDDGSRSAKCWSFHVPEKCTDDEFKQIIKSAIADFRKQLDM